MSDTPAPPGTAGDPAAAQHLYELLDKVDDALGDSPHHLRVLVTLRVAASWCIANSVSAEQFADAAARVFADTVADMEAVARELAAGGASGVDVGNAEG